MAVGICPECEAKINFRNSVQVRVGDQTFCPECGMELEVISAKPLTLDYVLDDDDDEDWEEDWDEE